MWLWGLEWNGKTRFSRLDWLYRERVCWRDTGERLYTCIYGPVGIISGGGSLVGPTMVDLEWAPPPLPMGIFTSVSAGRPRAASEVTAW